MPLRTTTLVLMAGTGSDDDYLRRSFGPAATEHGAELVTLPPSADLVDGYRRGLDAAAAEARAQQRRILVGGVSIGAVIGLAWALDHADDDVCAGVLAALPPWSGAPGESLAALSARLTADTVEADGVEAAIAAMAEGSPGWLAAELSRSWRALADRDLPGQLRQAARVIAPTLADLGGLGVPLGIAAAPDDLLHPLDVAHAWATAAPRAGVEEISLAEFGPRERLLGDACVRAWLRAAASSAPPADSPGSPTRVAPCP